MKIVPQDLSSQLKRDLKAVYLITGDEPLQRQESFDLIRKAAKEQEFNERSTFEINHQFDWTLFFAKLNMPSLFSEKQLVECHFPEGAITKTIAEMLLKLKSRLTDRTIIFLLSFEKLNFKDQQSSWFTALEQQGCFLTTRGLSSLETKQWLKRRLQEQNLSLSTEACDLLLERTEGNLSATAQAIEKLKISGFSQTITGDQILAAVASETRFTVFDLIDSLLTGTLKRTSTIFQSLKSEGLDPILVLWGIAREVRMTLTLQSQIKAGKSWSQAFAENGVWKRRESLLSAFIKRTNIQLLQSILSTLSHIDDVIKGRTNGNPWDLLYSTCLQLTDFNRSQ
jgi:DNA polymerase-3 subunit delta